MAAICITMAAMLNIPSFGEIESFKPTEVNNPEVTPLLFSIPAPRGRILDRQGKVLADTAVMRELTVSLPTSDKETSKDFIRSIRNTISTLPDPFKDSALELSDEDLEDHFIHRRRLPVVITKPLVPDTEALAKVTDGAIGTRAVYMRSYPHGDIAAHVLGRMSPSEEVLKGPIRQEENYWRSSVGITGIEKSQNNSLAGVPGKLILGVNPGAMIISKDLLEAPTAGADVVTTLDLPLQKAAQGALAETERPGAIVVMNAVNGDILAMASEPTYSPGDFVPSVDNATYSRLVSSEAKPLFNRAISAAYPPGSTMKPIVGLAALQSGAVRPYETFVCGPELEIDGRIFRNWSDKDQGHFNLRAALIRSHNSWFYQAAMQTRDKPILIVAKRFGLSTAPDLPLDQVSAGSLPEKAPSNQGLANLSIGQGTTSATPIQIARMMAGFCNGTQLPSPRLIMQTQNQDGTVITSTPPTGERFRRSPLHEMAYVKNGLHAVVNHAQGTGAKARTAGLSISGKTGTSQWSNNGEQTTVVWFTGYVTNTVPQISFAVALEGKPGEVIYGGANAAPVIHQTLSEGLNPESGSFVKRPRHSRETLILRDNLNREADIISEPIPKAIPVTSPGLQSLRIRR